MNHSTKLKIFTLLSQAFILVGAGHGVAPLVLFEAVGFFQPFDDDFKYSKLDWAILIYAVIVLLAQLTIVASIFANNNLFKQRLHIVGVTVLFGSTFFISLLAYSDPNSTLLYWTLIPFLICFLLTIFGKRLASWTRPAT